MTTNWKDIIATAIGEEHGHHRNLGLSYPLAIAALQLFFQYATIAIDAGQVIETPFGHLCLTWRAKRPYKMPDGTVVEKRGQPRIRLMTLSEVGRWKERRRQELDNNPPNQL